MKKTKKRNGFFSDWIEHRRKVKLARIKNDKSLNSNIVVVCLFAALTIAIIAAAIFGSSVANAGGKVASDIVNGIGGAYGDTARSLAPVLASNPEIAALIYSADKEDDKAAMKVALAMILKQISAEGKIDGEFNGHFTTRVERDLEKVDLTCVDQYTYTSIDTTYSGKFIRVELLKDSQCLIFGEEGNTTFWKCPVFNCQRREVNTTLNDQFIAEDVSITGIATSYNGGKR